MLRHVSTILAFAVAIVYAAAKPTQHEVPSMITAAPKLVELRKRYVYYVYYQVDYAETTTCGVIPYALASQNGLYGTDTVAAAAGTPYPVTCEGLCANEGSYLGCVDRSTQPVATACTDYSPQATGCYSDEPCYWDVLCDEDLPYCNQNIYSGSITQFSCGASKYAPITITEAVSMTAYTAAPMNTTTSATSSASETHSTDTSIAEALSSVGLSIGALVGICVAAIVLFCGGCCGFCYWRSRRASKKKYGAAPYMQAPMEYNHAIHSQQPLMSQPPHYQQYQQYPYHQ